MNMSEKQSQPRSERCQKLREAEGLIELATVPAVRLGLSRHLKHRMARRAIRLVVHLSPAPGEAWKRDLVIGDSLRLLGKYRSAVGPFLSSVRRNSQQRAGWVGLGWCLRRAGELERAAAALAKAIVQVPDDAVLHYNFACYLALLGQSDLAISEIMWALDLNPELRTRLKTERDFDKLRGSESFEALSCQPH